MKQVFISYANQDYSFAHKLVRGLERFQIRGWLDSTDVAAGAKLTSALREAMRESDAIIVVVSRHSIDSASVNFEIGVGLMMDVPIIPVINEDWTGRNELPEALRKFQALDARKLSISEIAQRVEKAISKSSTDGGPNAHRREHVATT